MHDLLLAHPVFAMAAEQFDETAQLLELEDAVAQRCKWPRRIISVNVPVRDDNGKQTCYQGYRVQHHLSTGPVKGGLRFHPEVELGEVAALAMWMSWKCGLFQLPFGGGKGGINCTPATMSTAELERLTRRFTMEMIPFINPELDVMAPDMGTNEQTMAWMLDTYSTQKGNLEPGIVTGKPIALEGSQGRTEATGRGVAFLILNALEKLAHPPSRPRVICQGFGNVGFHAAEILHQNNCLITAVSDHLGGIENSAGIDPVELHLHVQKTGSVKGYPQAQACDPSTILERECDVLIPAAIPAVINEHNAAKLRCRILAEAANGPTTPAADRILQESEIEILPDILCNGGGVTVSYFEWVQNRQRYRWSLREVRSELEKSMHEAWRRVQNQKERLNCTARQAALSLGIERAAEVRQLRGLFP